jgi:hypothetical protein
MSEENQRREIMPVKISESGVIKPANLHEAIEVSKLIAHSGMVPKDYIGKPGAVLVAIEMGHELGLSPMSAIQNIAVINGRPSLWGDAMLALCASHRDCEDIVETLDEKTMTATCMVKRRGRSPVERTFSMADAKTAGLAGKQGPWSQYPKRMLQQRARGFALRDAFPDALRGVVSREEAYDTIHVSQDPLEIIPKKAAPRIERRRKIPRSRTKQRRCHPTIRKLAKSSSNRAKTSHACWPV